MHLDRQVGSKSSSNDPETQLQWVELLQKTGLKCHNKVMSMISREEAEVKHPITRIEKPELENFKEKMRCPISQRIMLNPVALDCGHAFEHCNIARWRQRDKTCPICRKDQSTFHEIYALKNMALPYLEKEQKRYREVYKEIQLSMNM